MNARSQSGCDGSRIALRCGRAWGLTAVCVFLGMLGPTLAAAPAAARQQASAPPSAGQMHVHVDLVNVVASVLNASGKPVADLPRSDFRISQDGRPQRIARFERRTELPLDLVMMIDTSASAYTEMKFERQAAVHFIDEVLRPGDRMAIFTFAYRIHRLAPFTADKTALIRSLRRMHLGTGTSLWDAIYLGSHDLMKRPSNRRRVLLLITDAGETTSHLTYSQARAAAIHAGEMVYTVLINPMHNWIGTNLGGVHAVETIIDETGGAVYPVETAEQFQPTFDRIDAELRTEYLLGFYPEPTPLPGSYHTIRLRLRAAGPGDRVRYRKAYYIPKENQ